MPASRLVGQPSPQRNWTTVPAQPPFLGGHSAAKLTRTFQPQTDGVCDHSLCPAQIQSCAWGLCMSAIRTHPSLHSNRHRKEEEPGMVGEGGRGRSPTCLFTTEFSGFQLCNTSRLRVLGNKHRSGPGVELTPTDPQQTAATTGWYGCYPLHGSRPLLAVLVGPFSC